MRCDLARSIHFAAAPLPFEQNGRRQLRTFTTSWESLMRGPDAALSEMIESFLMAKEAEGRSARTIEQYTEYLGHFERWVGGGTLTKLTPEAATRYISERRRHSPTIGRLSAAILKSFASWLASMGYLATPIGGSVLGAVKTPRYDRVRQPYTDDEVRKMIRVLSTSELRTRARDKVVVLTLIATGLRLNELRELRLVDVHIQRPIEESYLFVRADTSKSKASRQVRLDRIAAEAVVAYVKDWRPDKGDNASLILTEEGKTFTASGMDTYMARIGERFEAAGIENWMAHRARHYWATSAHRAGMTPFDIATEGGWKDLKMVQRYTKARPFQELQRLPTPLSSVLGRTIS